MGGKARVRPPGPLAGDRRRQAPPSRELYQDEAQQRLHRQLDELLEAGYADHAAEVIQREYGGTIGTFHRTCAFLREQVDAEACVLLSTEGRFPGLRRRDPRG